MNGVPMTLKSVQSRLHPNELFNYYESQMRSRGHSELRRSASDDWQRLAIKSPRYYVTIQVRETHAGCEGTIAVSALPVPTKYSSDFPRPLTARLLGLQEYEDDGIASEHLSLSSARSPMIEAQAFTHELTRAGWQATLRQAMRGAVIEAQRGSQHSLITIQPDHAQPSMTAIVIVWRRS